MHRIVSIHPCIVPFSPDNRVCPLSHPLYSCVIPSMWPPVVLLGMSGVGKSNLMGRFIHDRFSETEAATVGVDFSSKLLEAADGTKVRAQVWDTGESRAWASCTVCTTCSLGDFPLHHSRHRRRV